ncbi:39 kDa FK506-binding nuclear protein-like [Drosophila serrata]|uniref:39 kDa FK506-binding nuclear protein-like n=1 Tax=Drosophila serrata TaxID=7274 RepID=UPI000A1D24B8|nr:39 kDa FK506-binding nuclear protein-like [Drosophila serrata]
MPEFFGLNMTPGTEYICCTPKSLHISGVAIDSGEIAKIYLMIEDYLFIVATVSPVIPQALLNFNFSKGEEIVFKTEGNATVSLFGYWKPEEDDDSTY